MAAISWFAVIFALLPGRPVRADESWFLWITTRASRGDALYRDVYYVTTPLAAWLGTVAVSLFGSTVLVTRALTTACFTCSTVLALSVVRRCGVRRTGQILLVAALFVYASPLANFVSLYSSLSLMFALAALVVLLRWLDAGRDHLGPRWWSAQLMWVGTLCGLSAASKPNIGAVALIACVVTTVSARAWRDPRSWRTDVTSVIAACVAVLAVVVGVVAANGGLAGFIDDVIRAKAYYFRAFNGSYLPGLLHLSDAVLGRGRRASIASRVAITASLLPFVAAAALVFAFARGPRSRRVHILALAGFALVVVIATVPRAGPQHLAETAPLLLAITFGAVALARPAAAPRRSRHVVVAVLALWLTFGSVVIVGRVVDSFENPQIVTSGLPHVGGGTTTSKAILAFRAQAAHFRSLHATTVFIVREDAGLYYLADSLRNPTPFDYAAVSDLGRSDQTGVISLLQRRRVEWVCVPAPPGPKNPAPPSRPLQLEAYVRSHLRFRARLRGCDLYQRAPRNSYDRPVRPTVHR